MTTEHKPQRDPVIYGDRRVHAVAGEWQLVRYDRAGKWYEEYEPARGRSADAITVRLAAMLAVRKEREEGGWIYLGVPGGRRFDQLVEVERDF